jgi:hypothetical protein
MWEHVNISGVCQSTQRHNPEYCYLSFHHKRTSDLLRYEYTKVVEISRLQRLSYKPVSTVTIPSTIQNVFYLSIKNSACLLQISQDYLLCYKHLHITSCIFISLMDQDSVVGWASRWKFGRPGDRIWVSARFFVPVHTDPRADPAFYIMGIG